MHQSVIWLLGAVLVSAGCSSNDTVIAKSGSAVNGDACEVGSQTSECRCESDGRWLCAWQNSVECRGVYGRGGGRLLVEPPGDCEMKWSNCSDGREYGVTCDGLRCMCRVGGFERWDFEAPRCADLEEANRRCLWSIKLPGATGSAPVQGMPCATVGEKDTVFGTNCVCRSEGWACPEENGCYLPGSWDGTTGAGNSISGLWIASDGVFDWRSLGPTPLRGTWQRNGTNFYVRSIVTDAEPECESKPGKYVLTWSADCGASFQLVEDTCTRRAALFDGLVATRRPYYP